ncbi:hypothetical protein PAMP_022964 [Pampus punctatissimus]
MSELDWIENVIRWVRRGMTVSWDLLRCKPSEADRGSGDWDDRGPPLLLRTGACSVHYTHRSGIAAPAGTVHRYLCFVENQVLTHSKRNLSPEFRKSGRGHGCFHGLEVRKRSDSNTPSGVSAVSPFQTATYQLWQVGK